MTLTIRFAKTSSSNFDLALALVADHPTLKVSKVGRQTLYELSPDADNDISLMRQLLSYIAGWKSAMFFIDGKLAFLPTLKMSLYCMDLKECEPNQHYWCKTCLKPQVEIDKFKKQLDKLDNLDDGINVFIVPE